MKRYFKKIRNKEKNYILINYEDECIRGRIIVPNECANSLC